jgi:hypothetical protein
MIYAAIVAAAILTISIWRIVFLNSEVKTLDNAGIKLKKAIKPQERQEAETEYAWTTNARDLKKEGRTMWYGLALLSLVVLITAVIELLKN